MPTVDRSHVGDVWPKAHPGEDPVLYGRAELEPSGAFEVRSLQTFRLVYTVGRYGIDDTGCIKVVFRAMGDWGHLQTNDPRAYGYVTASASNGATIDLDYSRRGAGRPWWRTLTATLHGGYLREGETITVIFGDTAKGSPGMKMQTMVESGLEFRVLADVCAVGQAIPLVTSPSISVVPGAPETWRAVVPTLRRPGETFQLGLKAEDLWGNPSDRAQASLRLEPSMPVKGLPESVDFALGERALTLEGLSCVGAGTLWIDVMVGNDRVARAGPLLIAQGEYSGYWGDLHGQSGESIGITTAVEYFDFARNKAFLDVTSHQANDFQVNNAFWAHINELTAHHQEDGRFVTFPGYEWSGNTAVGGDRNVFFRTEGRQIHRSSHALLSDRSDIDTDASDAGRLFEALHEEDCVVYAHVGGRYADIDFAHDGTLETAMEIHSAWGTFEWLLTDGFALGHRCGVVCNSDGHKGRPGASYPGASMFGAYGGLTCFLASELTRDGIFDALRRRHHYATTGCRMHLAVFAEFDQPANVFERDPKAFPSAASAPATRVMMGDIVQSDADSVAVEVDVVAHAPIERVEVRNATHVIERLRPFTAAQLGARVRVVWSGAEYRGRGRETNWVGRARFHGCTINRMTKLNAWNHERLLEQRGSDTVEWDAITTGNFGGFDAYLDEGAGARLEIRTNLGDLDVGLDELAMDDVVFDAGGLERQIRVMRLPDERSPQAPRHSLSARVQVPLDTGRDNPLWVCVTTEDGFQAWSSPIFVFK
ncbi:MAG: hypothetical protein ACI9W2_001146 [Gammaproteobacteria bacterium]|jgi:hypothetical protein